MSFLCTELKAVGPLLDTNNKDKLDILQIFLTKICQVTELDLVLRLQVLEMIELRTLGWKTNERFAQAQFEESRRRKQERQEAKVARSKKLKPSLTPSMSSIQEQTSEQEKDFVTDIGVKMFLHSSSTQLTASGKKLLHDHFTNQSSSAVPLSSSNMQYSGRDLLTQATSPLAREAPLNWDSLVKTLPAVIQKSPGTRLLQ